MLNVVAPGLEPMFISQDFVFLQINSAKEILIKLSEIFSILRFYKVFIDFYCPQDFLKLYLILGFSQIFRGKF